MHSRRRFFLGTSALLLSGPLGARAQTAPPSDAKAQRLIQAAETQIGVTTRYDAAYVRLAFPGGDVPRERGVCTDVVVRAYRDAFGVDLQALVNADMRKNFGAYPTRWRLTAPDPNIDHRRVPNLEVFFTRAGASLPIPQDASQWQPGDLVTQRLNAPGSRVTGPPHIGIVSGARDATSGRLLVIHNIGGGTRAEDIVAQYAVTGRFRYFPAA
jgi:uncharacterized protein